MASALMVAGIDSSDRTSLINSLVYSGSFAKKDTSSSWALDCTKTINARIQILLNSLHILDERNARAYLILVSKENRCSGGTLNCSMQIRPSYRMIADPSFLYKLLLEEAATIGSTVWCELKNRKGGIKEEWDLALINVMTVASCNAFIVWSVAPCRSYGSTFQFDLQNTIQKLPNNIFEESYPMREFDLRKTAHSFFYKAAELCLVGLIAGSIQGSLTKVFSARKERRLSVIFPSVSSNALGHGAFLGLYSNLRYQLIYGIDRAMFECFDVLGVLMFLAPY